jgi:hypothetical protein
LASHPQTSRIINRKYRWSLHYLWVFYPNEAGGPSDADQITPVQFIQYHIAPVPYRQDNFSRQGRKLSGPTAHALLHRRNHNQDWLSIEPGMRQPTTELTAFLTKSTHVAAEVSCKVTCSLTLFTLRLILQKASAAPTWPMKCLPAALFVIRKSFKFKRSPSLLILIILWKELP